MPNPNGAGFFLNFAYLTVRVSIARTVLSRTNSLTKPGFSQFKHPKEEDTSMIPTSLPAVLGSQDRANSLFTLIAPKSSVPLHSSLQIQSFVRKILVVAALSLVCGILSASAQSFSGQATAVRSTVTVPLAPVVSTAVADTGELTSSGGSISIASAGATVPSVLSVGSSNVSTSGSGGLSHSTASVNNLNIGVLSNTITASVVSSTTDCSCPTATCTGSSTITNLTINGTAIVVDGSVNQTIPLPGGIGNVIINEHITSSRIVTVNAIHVFVTALDLTTTDVVIASARSGINCTTLPPANLYSGRGVGIDLTQSLGLPPAFVSTIVSDTGPLPTSGGSIAAATAGAGAAPLLSSGTVTVATSGGSPPSTSSSSQSNASVQNLGINALSGIVTIDAAVLTSNSQCSCSASVGSCSGNSAITNLVVTALGLPVSVPISGLPNQTVSIPVLGFGSVTLVINEQFSGTPADITVNALHVTLSLTGLAATDVVIASSHSDIVCALGPSAADASISGRVTDSKGYAIRGVAVSVFDTNGNTKTVLTNAFGYYSVMGLNTGKTYVIRATHRTYTFSPRTITLRDNLAGFDFSPDLNFQRF
jgi:hypothetical protein